MISAESLTLTIPDASSYTSARRRDSAILNTVTQVEISELMFHGLKSRMKGEDPLAGRVPSNLLPARWLRPSNVPANSLLHDLNRLEFYGVGCQVIMAGKWFEVQFSPGLARLIHELTHFKRLMDRLDEEFLTSLLDRCKPSFNDIAKKLR
jgi:hypothetical protein